LSNSGDWSGVKKPFTYRALRLPADVAFDSSELDRSSVSCDDECDRATPERQEVDVFGLGVGETLGLIDGEGIGDVVGERRGEDGSGNN
jgi:hypothetical protein